MENAMSNKRLIRKKCVRSDGCKKVMMCMVCGKQAARLTKNTLICDACKKFFYRHVDEDWQELQCKTGLGSCAIFYEVGPAPCTKCRFWKCVSIGMTIAGKCQSPSLTEVSTPTSATSYEIVTSPSVPVPVLASPNFRMNNLFTSFDARKESMINCIIGAHFSLTSLNSITAENTNENPELCWTNFMENFCSIATIVSSFVKQLPGYNELVVGDRCQLFSKSVIPIAAAAFCGHQCTSNKANPFFGMNETTLHNFLTNFPIFDDVVKRFNNVATAIAELRPSATEQALLEAVFFYRSQSMALFPNIENIHLVTNIGNYIESNLLFAACSFRDAYVKQVMNTINLAVLCFTKAVITLKAMSPFLFLNNDEECRLFLEIINKQDN